MDIIERQPHRLDVINPLAKQERFTGSALEFECGEKMMASVSHRVIKMDRVVGREVGQDVSPQGSGSKG